jgi:hypothetical protein
MSDADETPVEYQLVHDATLWDFEVTSTEITPTVGNEDFIVRIEIQVEEDGIEHMTFPVVFTLAMLSFHDARPRGISGKWFEDEDQLTAADMLRHLRFERGRLHLHLDYLRGRCVKTTVEVDSTGKLFLQTVNRGQAATRWVEMLRGKKYLKAAPVLAGCE